MVNILIRAVEKWVKKSRMLKKSENVEKTGKYSENLEMMRKSEEVEKIKKW